MPSNSCIATFRRQGNKESLARVPRRFGWYELIDTIPQGDAVLEKMCNLRSDVPSAHKRGIWTAFLVQSMLVYGMRPGSRHQAEGNLLGLSPSK